MTRNNISKVKIPPEGKIYDSDGFWLRAAAVCVRDDSESEILLVSSSGHSDRWIIPGGKVEPNECPEKSAMREAMEEGGVVGKLGRYLGCFDNVERRHRTWVYVLRVSHLLDDFEDKDRRQRQWFSVDEAQRILVPHKPNHLRYLAAFIASKESFSSNGVVAVPSACPNCCRPATNGIGPTLVPSSSCNHRILPTTCSGEKNPCSCFLVS